MDQQDRHGNCRDLLARDLPFRPAIHHVEIAGESLQSAEDKSCTGGGIRSN